MNTGPVSPCGRLLVASSRNVIITWVRMAAWVGLFAVLAAGRLGAQTITASIDTAYFGYLDQYSMNGPHNFVGDEACYPTSSTNGMTLLQNLYPTVFGTALTGSNYTTWKATDDLLISPAYMNTTAGNGTYDYRLVHGLYDYIVTTQGFSNTVFTGLFPDGDFVHDYPRPSWADTGTPTAQYLYNGLATNSMVFFSIQYFDGGGHGLLANSISWNLTSNTGTLGFIDPLDPSATYTGNIPDGPAKSSIATLTYNTTISSLEIEYDQYQGNLSPYNPSDYQHIHAYIFSSMTVNVPEPSVVLMAVTLSGTGLVVHFARRRTKA